MDLLRKSFSTKIITIFATLLLSACGGRETSDPSSSATASTADLQTLANNASAQPLVVAPVPSPAGGIATTNEIVSAALGRDAGLFGFANVYVGTLDLPYYFDTTNSLTSFWLPSLAARETITVPVMMTLPISGSIIGQNPTDQSLIRIPERPDAGWPIVMYQHGITRNRTDVLLYADAQAAAGFATIAIDLPAHGLTDETNLFNAVNTAFPTDIEQTFGIDILTQDPTTGATIATEPDGSSSPDGIFDSSGSHFINLRSLLTSRDNLRQGAANLLTLRKSLGGIINAATGMPETIDTSKVGLIAHSLGGMVALPYLAVEATPTPSSIVMSGATITDTLRNSASFAPVIEDGLERLDVDTPAGIAAFYANAQELIDAGEPANYAADAAAKHPIHLIEVIGDATVPNVATENLATLMGAASVSTTTSGIAAGNPGIVRFTTGEHGSPLTPNRTINPDGTPNLTLDADFLAVTREIQRQLANFQGSAISPTGPVIVISDPSVIQ